MTQKLVKIQITQGFDSDIIIISLNGYGAKYYNIIKLFINTIFKVEDVIINKNVFNILSI